MDNVASDRGSICMNPAYVSVCLGWRKPRKGNGENNNCPCNNIVQQIENLMDFLSHAQQIYRTSVICKYSFETRVRGGVARKSLDDRQAVCDSAATFLISDEHVNSRISLHSRSGVLSVFN